MASGFYHRNINISHKLHRIKWSQRIVSHILLVVHEAPEVCRNAVLIRNTNCPQSFSIIASCSFIRSYILSARLLYISSVLSSISTRPLLFIIIFWYLVSFGHFTHPYNIMWCSCFSFERQFVWCPPSCQGLIFSRDTLRGWSRLGLFHVAIRYIPCYFSSLLLDE